MGGVFFFNMNNYLNFLKEFEKAVLVAKRNIEEINLIAVSKKKAIKEIQDVYNLGQRFFGENQLQEIDKKWHELKKNNAKVSLHFLGTIQSNKTKSRLENCDYIHTVDRLKIVNLIKNFENNTGLKRKYFIQVNTGNESQKSGVNIDDAEVFIQNCMYKQLEIYGLMCLPPINELPTKHFNSLRSLAKNFNIKNLSMGMSQDFTEAIRCGSTHIRIGTNIFGARD